MHSFLPPFYFQSQSRTCLSGKPHMRTRRSVSVNNSLCHGICNYNCKLCGVNKPNYKGPREYQPREVTSMLIERIKSAALMGMEFNIITNSGDGEPTLHPEFDSCLDMFGDMIRNWNAPVSLPELTIVTNGSTLVKNNVVDALIRNPVTVNISFPTSDPFHYGELMLGDPSRGEAMLKRVITGIRNLFKLQGKGLVNRICFHISPPDRTVIRNDFDNTVRTLTRAACSEGVEQVELVMFPATTNRSGLIRNSITTTDFYKDLFKKYHQKHIDGVRILMTTVLKRFFKTAGEIIDLVRAYNYPCIWNGNFFITPDGSSICCNDQAVINPLGNIMEYDLHTLMQIKERYIPNAVCRGCDQQLRRMKGSPTAWLLNIFGRIRLQISKIVHWWKKVDHSTGSNYFKSQSGRNPGVFPPDTVLQTRFEKDITQKFLYDSKELKH